MVGEANMDGDYFLWTHKKIEIGFNGNQVNNTQSCMLKVEVHLHVDYVIIMLTLHVHMYACKYNNYTSKHVDKKLNTALFFNR